MSALKTYFSTEHYTVLLYYMLLWPSAFTDILSKASALNTPEHMKEFIKHFMFTL